MFVYMSAYHKMYSNNLFNNAVMNSTKQRSSIMAVFPASTVNGTRVVRLNDMKWINTLAISLSSVSQLFIYLFIYLYIYIYISLIVTIS